MGVLGFGSLIRFFGMRISVDAVWGLWCGAFWVLSGWGSLTELKNIIGINTDFNISSSRNSDKSHAILKMCDY